MRRKQEVEAATQEEMASAVGALVKVLEFVDDQMDALKEERKIAIETCVAAGVPKPVVAELIRRMGMDQDTKNTIDVYVPILEKYLEENIN